MYKLGLEKAEEPNCQHLLDHKESKGISEKHLLLIDYTKDFDCVDHNKLWKILKEMGVPEKPEKLVCRSRSNSWNWTWNNGLIQNLERGMLRLYIVTLLI